MAVIRFVDNVSLPYSGDITIVDEAFALHRNNLPDRSQRLS